jgi:hypothetical protein
LEPEPGFFREKWLWLIFAAYLTLVALSFNRGLFLSDEGYQLYYAWLMAHGEKIYKDFFLTVAPLAYMLQALLIKTLGPDLIYSRIYAALYGVACFFALAYISRKSVPGKWWLMSAGLIVIFSNNLINVSQHCVMAKYFFIFSTAFAILYFETGRLSAFFLSGLFAGAASFSYQSLAAAGLGQMVLILWYGKGRNLREWVKPVIIHGAGFGVVALIVFIYLARLHLLEESFNLTVLGNRKQHVFVVLFKYVFPAILAIFVLNFVPIRYKFKKYNPVVSALMQGVFILIAGSVLANAFENLSFAGNVLSWILPTALFAAAFAFLKRDGAAPIQLAVFYTSALFFWVGLLGGYDIGHNLSSALLLIPWTGYLFMKLWRSGAKKIIAESLPLALALALVLFGLLTMVVWRWELWGEVEPLFRCNSRLELKTAKWIYTSPERKNELETVVDYIVKNTGPEDRILVYPNQLLIYYLAERASLSKAPFFYYETTNLGELEKAAALSKKNQTPVIFQLQEGRLFQPLNSMKAENLIEDLEQSCLKKIRLPDYLICEL